MRSGTHTVTVIHHTITDIIYLAEIGAEVMEEVTVVEAMGVRDPCQMSLPSQRLLATFLPTSSRVTWTQFSKT